MGMGTPIPMHTKWDSHGNPMGIPWDSHGNGSSFELLMGIEIGMGIVVVRMGIVYFIGEK